MNKKSWAAHLLPFLFALQLSVGVRLSLGATTTNDLTFKLNKHVTDYNIGVFSPVGALIRVSNDFQIPMGIVWVNSPAERAEFSFAWKSATVKEIIEDIAKTQSGYQVQVSNDIVHVQPLIPDAQNFLKTSIEAFSVHDAYVELAYFKLHSLLTPRRSRNQQISIAGPGDFKVTVELKNCTAEDTLDALTTASNRKIWIVTFSDDTRLTPQGLRRSMSLWSEGPGPDEDQPAWDILRWGDPLPPLLTKNRLPNVALLASKNNEETYTMSAQMYLMWRPRSCPAFS